MERWGIEGVELSVSLCASLYEERRIDEVVGGFREIPKRANVIKLSRDGEVVLAADKFGDIFR